MTREFDVIIERDDEGWLIASVPQLAGCHTQARSLDELMRRIEEAARLCLEVSGDTDGDMSFVGLQRLAIEV
jgi:predicted RNase H-like HicB family nuclease